MSKKQPDHREPRHVPMLLAIVGIITLIGAVLMLSEGQQAGRATARPDGECAPRAYCEGSTRILLQEDCTQVAIPCKGGCARGACTTTQSCEQVQRCEGDTAVIVTMDCEHSAHECGRGRCSGGRCV